MFQRSAGRFLHQSAKLHRFSTVSAAAAAAAITSTSTTHHHHSHVNSTLGAPSMALVVMNRNFHMSTQNSQQANDTLQDVDVDAVADADDATGETTVTQESSDKPSVTVFGGSGFVGSHVVRALAPHCSHITVGCRYPDEFNAMVQQELAANPESPWKNVSAQEVNVTDPIRVEQLIASSDVVINLVGIQYESNNSFVETFVDGSRNIFHAAHRLNTKRAINMTILGAEVDNASRWLDMLFRSDDMSYASYPDVTILRPSLIFGDGSKLFQRARSVFKLMPFLPVNAQGSFQPIHVNDVAEAVVKCVLNEDTKGQVYELGGPNVYDFKGLMKAISGRSGTIPVMRAFWDMLFGVTQFLPSPTFTRDHIPLMDAHMSYTDDAEVKTLKDLGIEPKSMEEAW